MSRSGVHANRSPDWVVLRGQVMALDQLMDRPDVHPPLVHPGLPKVIIQLSPDGTFVHVNEIFEIVFRYWEKEVRQLDAAAMLRPQPGPDWRVVTSLRARDGHDVHVRVLSVTEHPHLVTIEAEVLSNEVALWRRTQPQFASPFDRLALDAWVQDQRTSSASRLQETETRSLHLRAEGNRHVEQSNHRIEDIDEVIGLHRPKPPFDDLEYLLRRLDYALEQCHDVWHPTIDEMCRLLPEDPANKISPNTLKNWLAWHHLLRQGKPALTLRLMAEERGLLGDRLDD